MATGADHGPLPGVTEAYRPTNLLVGPRQILMENAYPRKREAHQRGALPRG